MPARPAGVLRGLRAPQLPRSLRTPVSGGLVAFGGWALLGLGTLAGCDPESISPGVLPPNDALAFPHGMLLDPRVPTAAGASCADDSQCQTGESCVASVCRTPARWMFVANGNSDLSFNAGTLMGFDLDAFFAAVENTGAIGDQGAKLTAETPCRRAQLQPNLVECEERFFAAADATVHMGHFASEPDGWDCEVIEVSPAAAPGEERPQTRRRHCPEGEAMILTPINGDPSITYAYIRGGLDGGDDLEIECGQGPQSGHPDSRRCADDFRLRYRRNDEEDIRLPREIANLHVSNDPHHPVAYAVHRVQGALSLVRLDGLRGGRDLGDWADPLGPVPDTFELEADPRRPAIVDYSAIFAVNNSSGGYGIAERFCDPANAPSVTNLCTRPLLYSTFRFASNLALYTIAELSPDELGTRRCALEDDESFAAGVLDCDPRLVPLEYTNSGQLGGIPASYGDLEFSRDGENLFIVQSAPGGLIRVNTGVDALGEPFNEPNKFVELCDGPASLALYEDGRDSFGITSCYRSALVYIVDLESMNVVKQLTAGTGPHRITPDLARQVVYVGNTLDNTISVIDMARDRASRFSQIARLGVQEPYEQ